MNIDTFAAAHLISTVPAELPFWHWTRSPASARQLGDILSRGGDLSHLTEGAIGGGLYLSLSAIDTMDKGSEVLYTRLRAGTPVLMVDAELFNFGVPEIMEMVLEKMGWDWKPTPWRDQLAKGAGDPMKQVIPHLMEQLHLPVAAYIFGFHLAFMVRDSRCLIFDPAIDPADTVAEYHRAHPTERPMLARGDVVQDWLASRGKA